MTDPSHQQLAAIADRFKDVFQKPPTVIASAPGRINLIGEHTDYNDGFVLPAAIDRRVMVAARSTSDHVLTAHAAVFHETAAASLGDLHPTMDHRWMNYVAGVVYQLQQRGIQIPGLQVYIEGDVPLGSGLSSSAALEVATAYAVLDVAGKELPPMEIALLCQRAEHDFAGVQCGIMDQSISVLGKRQHALFLDCRSMVTERVPIPAGVRFVICDTGVARDLKASSYNERREACRRGVQAIARKYPEVRALRDVTSVMIDDFRSHLDPVVYHRCRHVVSENERVLQSVRALRNGDPSEFGKLMYQSHLSLKNDYEVSCPELDVVVDICAEEDGVFGARMTGAGFGGCAICMVQESHAESVASRLAEEYPGKTGRTPTIYVCNIEDGAAVHRL
jgi:galactokinase